MLAWVAPDRGVRAISGTGDVTIRTADWQDRESGPTLTQPVAEEVSGTVSELTVPVRSATLVDGSDQVLGDPRSAVELGGGAYRIEARLAADGPTGADRSGDRTSGMDLYCRFDGPATVERAAGTLTVSFPGPSPVTLGFLERHGDLEKITVEPTPEGIATATTHLSSALGTTAPARSHPSRRNHPPVVELGDETTVPDSVRAATPETGIELRLPPSFEHLLVSAPLAYYLGADVTVAEGTEPGLVAPGTDVEYWFHGFPTFQHEVAALLQQVFFLDTVVRDIEGEAPVSREKLLDRFDIDAARVRGMTPAKRLARYFYVSAPELREYLSDWHVSTYAEPEPGNARCLPYLLDALSLVYLPEASELDKTELLERTLDDCYRSVDGSSRSVPSVDVVSPQLQTWQVHAWLADGAPIDAFKTTPRAHENRQKYSDRPGTPLSVTVVLNDGDMSEEHAAAADIYRERAADLPLEVTVREHLSRDELREVFASPNDFVHYIGHCDADGLECPDGNFAASSVETCRTRTFFLNACGSYHEGLELVERGSIAGAVTLTKVLDSQAAKVGTAFARLLVHGFGLEPAMQLSRRRIMMGKDYAVVGDGTYSLAPTPTSPVVGWLESLDGGYRLTCEPMNVGDIGAAYQPPHAEETYYHGTPSEDELSRSELLALLRESSMPVIYDGEFHWSSELAAELAGR